MNRRIVLVVIALVIAAGAGAVLLRPAADAQTTDLLNIQDEAVVELGDLQLNIDATGVVSPAREADLSFGLVAPIAVVVIEEGDTVREGDLIAALDTADLDLLLTRAEIEQRRTRAALEDLAAAPREIDLAVAEASLAAQEAAAYAAAMTAPSDEDIEIARLETEIARNQLWQAQLQRDQVELLNPEFRTSDTNNANAQDIQLQSGIDSAEQGIEIAETQFDDIQDDGPAQGIDAASLEQAEIALEDLLDGADDTDFAIASRQYQVATLNVENVEASFDDALIVAPFDGTVTEANLTVGELPPAGGVAVRLADTGEYYIEINIDEDDVSQVVVGQSVALDLDALPETTIEGTITYVSLMPQQSTGVPVYTAHVTLAPTLEPIRAGMTATATIITDELADVLIVPTRFVRIAGGSASVTVIGEDGQAQPVPVTLGRATETETQIIDGLEAGQRVVIVGEAEE